MVRLTEVTSSVRRAPSLPRRANSSALQLPAMCEGVASQRRDARRQISDSGSWGNARRREGSGSCRKGCWTDGIRRCIREREEVNGDRSECIQCRGSAPLVALEEPIALACVVASNRVGGTMDRCALKDAAPRGRGIIGLCHRGGFGARTIHHQARTERVPVPGYRTYRCFKQL